MHIWKTLFGRLTLVGLAIVIQIFVVLSFIVVLDDYYKLVQTIMSC